MDELRQLIGFLIFIFSITLKANLSNINSLSSTVASLATRSLFSLDSFWRDTAQPVFTAPVISTIPVFINIQHAKCIPSDFNYTLPDFDYYQGINNQVYNSLVIAKHTESKATLFKNERAEVARKLTQYIMQTRRALLNPWWRFIVRILGHLRECIIDLALCIGCIQDPDILHAFEQIHRLFERRSFYRCGVHMERKARKSFSNTHLVTRYALEGLRHWTFGCSGFIGVLHALEEILQLLKHLGRNGVYFVMHGRLRKKPGRHRHARSKLPYLVFPNDGNLFAELPLVIHSFTGHGVFKLQWHLVSYNIIREYGRDVMQIVLIEYDFEGRLPHCTHPNQCGEPFVYLNIHIHRRICTQEEIDEWNILDINKRYTLGNSWSVDTQAVEKTVIIK